MIRSLVLFLTIIFSSSTVFAETMEERVIKLEEALVKNNEQSKNALNPSISIIVDSLYYHSNLTGGEMEEREIEGYRALHSHADGGHAHGEMEEGFNLRSAEISFFAPVDPYFNVKVTIPVSEGGTELEEAYFVTTALPMGYSLKAENSKVASGGLTHFTAIHGTLLMSHLHTELFLGERVSLKRGYSLLTFQISPSTLLLALKAFKVKMKSFLEKRQNQAPMHTLPL